MKIKLIGTPEIIMQNSASPHNYFAWPTVARLKDGRLAVAASGFRISHVCPFGKAVISYSSDNGKTYTLPTPVIDTPLDDRDGGLCPFGENGFILTSFNNTVAFQRETAASINNEKSRNYRYAYLDTVDSSAEERYLGVTYRVTLDGGITFGEVQRSPVSSPHGPIELKSGKILWLGRRMYAEDPDPRDEKISAYYIDPITAEYEHVGDVPNVIRNGEYIRAFEPNLYEREDGKLIAHIRVPRVDEARSHTIYQSTSTDGGKSWTVPVPLLGDGYVDGCPAHIIRHSSGVLISAYSYRKPPFGIKAMISTDGGESWDTSDHRIYTNTVSPDLGYPSTVEMPDGTMLTVFYARPSESSPCVIMQQRWVLED